MIRLSLAEIKYIYTRLLNEQISKDDADRWTYFIIQKHEGNELIFFPPKDEDKIWDGLMFLYGIDIQVAPGVDLYTLEDVQYKFDELFNTTSSDRA